MTAVVGEKNQRAGFDIPETVCWAVISRVHMEGGLEPRVYEKNHAWVWEGVERNPVSVSQSRDTDATESVGQPVKLQRKEFDSSEFYSFNIFRS